MGTPPKFTLRFHNPRTHEVLGLVAERRGVSKNQLAEEMLERELRAAALVLGLDLNDTLERLRGYNPSEHLDRAIAAVAEGEAYGDEPLKARRIDELAIADPHGVLDAFTR